MKLDPRIEGESLIHTPFSKTQVKLGEKGYFADVMSTFYDLKGCVYGELAEYNPDSDCPYWGKFDDSACPFSFYIPESSLKPEENKPTGGNLMKLDSRIEDESLIYTPFSNERINLEEKGYFADGLQAFSDLKRCAYGELVDCDFNTDYPYRCKSDCINQYAFYIPESKLKVPLTLEAVMKEISELRDELHAIKYQLNKAGSKVELKYKPSSNEYNPPYGFNQQDSFCTTINPQSNWCALTSYSDSQSNWCKQ